MGRSVMWQAFIRFLNLINDKNVLPKKNIINHNSYQQHHDHKQIVEGINEGISLAVEFFE